MYRYLLIIILSSFMLAVSIAGCGAHREGDVSKTSESISQSAGNSETSLGQVKYSPGTTKGHIDHDGLTRTFLVHVPPTYSAENPTPVVLMFHGAFASAKYLQLNTDMDKLADREGFITVYPDGTGTVKTWNAGTCCGPAYDNKVDDVGFVGALLDHLESSLNVDPKRIYASGMSNGAFMCHRLACEMSDRIAAIGPVSGSIMFSDCKPSRQVPIIIIHGTDDPHEPWEGGKGCGLTDDEFTSVPDTVKIWKAIDGCTGDETPSYVVMGDGHGEYQGDCSNGADVVLCTIEGGGHHWPGGVWPTPDFGGECRREDGHMSSTFIANEVLWKFFKEHPMN